MNLQKTHSELDKRFKKVSQTAAGFEFFLAIHDFVGHIESDKFLSKGLSHRSKINRDLAIAGKYGPLKEIYQGLEDIKPATANVDLGHARSMAVVDLNRIQKNDLSGNNIFWRKREFYRKSASEVYERLGEYLAELSG